MEADFNENYSLQQQDDYEFSEQVSWTNNPLFCDNANNKDALAADFLKTTERCERLGQCDKTCKNLDFETESGYSETVSIVSESSSPIFSVSSSVDLSDEEEHELIEEIAENMLQAEIMQANGREADGTEGCVNTAQIISSKGTVRGVKNRVRENILHFLSGSKSDSKKNLMTNAATQVRLSAV